MKSFSENPVVYKIMWENVVEWDRLQMAIWCGAEDMRIACRIINASRHTHTHTHTQIHTHTKQATHTLTHSHTLTHTHTHTERSTHTHQTSHTHTHTFTHSHTHTHTHTPIHSYNLVLALHNWSIPSDLINYATVLAGTEKLRNDLSVIVICVAKVYVYKRPSANEHPSVTMHHLALTWRPT